MARYNFDQPVVDNMGPVQRVSDSHCRTCGDEWAERELLAGRCFPCRYGVHLRTRRRLDVRASFGSSEGLIFPVGRGV